VLGYETERKVICRLVSSECVVGEKIEWRSPIRVYLSFIK